MPDNQQPGPVLFGPGGQPVTSQQQRYSYPLGESDAAFTGTPGQLFEQGFHGVDGSGQPAGHMPTMIQATWAAASLSVGQLNDLINHLGNHLHTMDFRVSAMERVLKRHKPDIHAEYIKEIEVVQKEFNEKMLAQMAAMQAQQGQQPQEGQPQQPPPQGAPQPPQGQPPQGGQPA